MNRRQFYHHLWGVALILCEKSSTIRPIFEEESKVAKVCEICGKKPITGHNVSHSHKATKRRWLPNLQKVRVEADGKVKRMRVCTRCIRDGKVVKAL